MSLFIRLTFPFLPLSLSLSVFPVRQMSLSPISVQECNKTGSFCSGYCVCLPGFKLFSERPFRGHHTNTVVFVRGPDVDFFPKDSMSAFFSSLFVYPSLIPLQPSTATTCTPFSGQCARQREREWEWQREIREECMLTRYWIMLCWSCKAMAFERLWNAPSPHLPLPSPPPTPLSLRLEVATAAHLSAGAPCDLKWRVLFEKPVQIGHWDSRVSPLFLRVQIWTEEKGMERENMKQWEETES